MHAIIMKDEPETAQQIIDAIASAIEMTEGQDLDLIIPLTPDSIKLLADHYDLHSVSEIRQRIGVGIFIKT